MNRNRYIELVIGPGASYCLVSSPYLYITQASVMFKLAVFKDIEYGHI